MTETSTFSKCQNLPIRHVVYQTEDFIVYIDNDLDIDWRTHRLFEANSHEHFLLINEAATLEATPCEGFSEKAKLQFKRLIAEGIARSLERDYESGRQMHTAAREFLVARSQEVSRRWYLTASLLTTLILIFIGIGIWVGRTPLFVILGEQGLWLPLAAMFGGLGACFSVITRTGKQTFDCSAGRALHYLEGSSRICAGALAGILVCLAVRSELVFSALTRGASIHLVSMLAAMAAGISERLATSIISTMDGSATRVEPDARRRAAEQDAGLAERAGGGQAGV